MGIAWDDDAQWYVTINETDLPEFRPYYTGNGRIGVRIGPLVLDWGGDTKPLLAEDGPDFWGRLNARLLISLAKHAYDGVDQLILPAWNQARLVIGGVEYAENNGRHRLRNTLDLRGGEVTCADSWEYLPGRTATVRLRLVVPRSHPCASWYEFSLSDLRDSATLRFGLNAGQVAGKFSDIAFSGGRGALLGRYTTRHQQRSLVQGLRWESAGWEETGRELGADRAWVSVATNRPSASLVVAHALHCSVDGAEPAPRVTADLDALDARGRDTAAARNRELWRNIWANALDFRHSERRWERLVFVNQFHLLASLNEDGGYPLGPLGLSRPGWHGSQAWDADFWIFRGVLPLWPELARGIVRFRRATLPAARANAVAQGLRGAFYPWISGDEGTDVTPAHYRQEIHGNAWIGLAAWEAAGVISDRVFLADITWPILSGVADFFVSRAARDTDGSWHLRGVVPPDESVAEAPRGCGVCDDSVLTNVAASAVLRRAVECARILGRPASADWSEAAAGLVVLPPGPDGIIPEYAGYPGHPIKQADTILAFYPLNLKVAPETLMRTLHYYHERAGQGGPLMTQQIEALLFMLHGERERGLEHLFTEYQRYVHGPHLIPFETPGNANSVMLTGIGGLLQALIFGWFGARLDGTARLPRIGDDWDGRT